MRKLILFFTLAILITSMMFSLPASAEWKTAYSNDYIGFSFSEGWSAREVRDEVNESLTSFDDEMVFRAIEILPKGEESGLMITGSSRDDDLATLLDYILLSQEGMVEFYALYEGDTEIYAADGTGIDARLSIYALDDGESEMLIVHDVYLFHNDIRYEFAYIVPAAQYAAQFDDIDLVFSSLEFK